MKQIKNEIAKELNVKPEEIIITDTFHNFVMFTISDTNWACNVTPTGKIKKNSLTNNF